MTDKIDEILETRGLSHGGFSAVSDTFTILMNEMINKNQDPMMQTALIMIAMKIARIVNGNSYEPDHWRDIEGYARLVRNGLVNGD